MDLQGNYLIKQPQDWKDLTLGFLEPGEETEGMPVVL